MRSVTDILADEFPLRSDICYLNHAAIGVWPRRTAAAVRAFADDNMVQGATDYPRWMQVERELRGRLARLLHAASSDDIALVKNTSEALSLIAYGLEWQPGDNIVSTDQEFPSNRIVWESLASKGVTLRLAVSSVQYGTGLRMDLQRLGAACRARGILFCVDAIQSLGALQFDAEECNADFVVADGHKWMLGPEGLALFYSWPAAREQLALMQYGWHMVERVGDFDAVAWQPAASARRFEPGSPNMLAIHALNASLSLLEEAGMAQIEAAVLSRAEALIAWVSAQPDLELVTPPQPDRHAGIVTFRRSDLDRSGHAALYRRLMAGGVICAYRAGGIRLSPHAYSDVEAFFPLWERLSGQMIL